MLVLAEQVAAGEMAFLASLDLSGTQVSSVSVQALLAAASPALKQLILNNCKRISRRDVADMERQAPGVRIVWC